LIKWSALPQLKQRLVLFSVEIVEHLAVSQTVAAVAEALEACILLVVGAGGKQIYQVGHSAAALWALHSEQIDAAMIEHSRVQWKSFVSFRHGVP
jgi:hypothetical protein